MSDTKPSKRSLSKPKVTKWLLVNSIYEKSFAGNISSAEIETENSLIVNDKGNRSPEVRETLQVSISEDTNRGVESILPASNKVQQPSTYSSSPNIPNDVVRYRRLEKIAFNHQIPRVSITRSISLDGRRSKLLVIESKDATTPNNNEYSVEEKERDLELYDPGVHVLNSVK